MPTTVIAVQAVVKDTGTQSFILDCVVLILPSRHSFVSSDGNVVQPIRFGDDVSASESIFGINTDNEVGTACLMWHGVSVAFPLSI